jgi:lysophospholipase L1-like esterase
MANDITRREFIVRGAAAVGGAALGGAALTAALSELAEAQAAPGPLILFQGDSITDASRNRMVLEPNVPRALGSGYAFLVASTELAENPKRGLRFLNRGISGNKVPDLAARWDADTIALKPDVLSVLIGVNDYWHHLLNNYPGTVKDYEDEYVALLERTRHALPAVRLVILEPFVLRTGAVDARWFPEFDHRREAARRVARHFRATWLPLQEMFDKSLTRAPASYWAADGVHPTPAGHAVIARRWLDATRI